MTFNTKQKKPEGHSLEHIPLPRPQYFNNFKLEKMILDQDPERGMAGICQKLLIFKNYSGSQEAGIC